MNDSENYQLSEEERATIVAAVLAAVRKISWDAHPSEVADAAFNAAWTATKHIQYDTPA